MVLIYFCTSKLKFYFRKGEWPKIAHEKYVVVIKREEIKEKSQQLIN